MYARLSPPRIILGAERPAGRQVYTCAHELGHHVLGHGTRVDELRTEKEPARYLEPEEYQAQVFAGLLLVPKLALGKAFSQRGWQPGAATAEQLYRIASLFGVGFGSLVRHLQLTLGVLDRERAEVFLDIKPAEIRSNLIGQAGAVHPLVVVDEFWSGRPVDLAIADRLLTPRGILAEGENLRLLGANERGSIWEPVSPGRCRLYSPEGTWAAFVRVSRTDFEGRSQFRHLPEVSEHD
jgi:hypothetical protein